MVAANGFTLRLKQYSAPRTEHPHSAIVSETMKLSTAFTNGYALISQNFMIKLFAFTVRIAFT